MGFARCKDAHEWVCVHSLTRGLFTAILPVAMQDLHEEDIELETPQQTDNKYNMTSSNQPQLGLLV